MEGAAARRPEGVAARREPEVLRRRRGRRERRGLHDLPGQGRVGGRLRRRARCAWSSSSRTSTAVERELWRFLHSIDLTVKVDVFSLDPASALFLNVRDPRALGLRLGDALWLRLVDLDAALKARSYKPGESIVLEVTDELCPWNAGRYRVGDDAGRTEDTADLALDVADLAAAYLGAFDFHRLVHAGRAAGAARRRRRGGDAALPHRSAAVLPGGVLDGLGRPPDARSRGVQARGRRDRPLLRRLARRRRGARSGSRATCRSTGCTPPSTATGSSAARERSRSS